eukprot:TRINITY_DN21428_c0_g1_i1.p2 TRINITY_DN21428_c0_g1~~TRINITY_DN21428_c0_g1_i1.p2  ORF type:complete len:102 (+),score=7.38 TRINITY_DN21428_c0_g1_i1:331-636(+)
MNRIVPAGIQIGLDRRINGVKKIKANTVAVRVSPVRQSKIPPETASVRNPMTWVDLGLWSLTQRRNVPPEGLVLDLGTGPEPGWRSAIVGKIQRLPFSVLE